MRAKRRVVERRKSHYNLRNTDCNLVQPSYNNRFNHSSFTYKLSHLWNQLPLYIKQSPNLSDFRKKLRSFDFSNLKVSCKCNYCLSGDFGVIFCSYLYVNIHKICYFYFCHTFDA